jgi:hypothetical protein
MVLRWSLIALATILSLGTGLELALERHWGTTVRMVPWFTLAVVLLAVALLVIRPTRGVVRCVRLMALAVAFCGAFGVYEHVLGNYNGGPLDFRYADRWATMSFTARWWAAISKTVGPAPVLAPAVLMQAAVLLFLATLHHPALARTVAGRLRQNPARDISEADPILIIESVGPEGF